MQFSHTLNVRLTYVKWHLKGYLGLKLNVMTYSAEWLRLCEAAQEYHVRQYEFKQDQEVMIRDLKKALLEDSLPALQLLVALEPEVAIVAPLLSTVLSLAIDSSSPDKIVSARAVLGQCKEDPWVRNTIQTLVAGYLPAQDDWNYRRIAELYEALSYKEELAAFLLLCQASENTDIQEISDDFD